MTLMQMKYAIAVADTKSMNEAARSLFITCLLYTSEEQYLEPYGPFADYVMDLNVVYDDASGMLTVLLPVTKKTTSDVAVVYAQDVLGTIGEAVSCLLYTSRCV